MKLTLTKHFTDRWMERVGNYPTEEAVTHFVRQSIKVQAGRDLKDSKGNAVRMLAIYWHPGLSMVIMIDMTRMAAVTVLTRENWNHSSDDGSAVMENCTAPGHVSAERIGRVKALFGRRPAWI